MGLYSLQEGAKVSGEDKGKARLCVLKKKSPVLQPPGFLKVEHGFHYKAKKKIGKERDSGRPRKVCINPTFLIFLRQPQKRSFT